MVKILRTFLYCLLALIGLVTAVLVSINFEIVNGPVSSLVTNFLSNKYNKTIRLNSFQVLDGHTLSLYGVYAEGFDADTLAKVDEIHVDVQLLKLFEDSLVVDAVTVCDANVKMETVNGESNFAYWAGEPKSKNDVKEKSDFVIDVEHAVVILDNVRYRFADNKVPLVTDSKVGYLEIQAGLCDFDSLLLNVPFLELDGTESSLQVGDLFLETRIDRLSVRSFKGDINDVFYGVSQVNLAVPFFKLGGQDTTSLRLDQIVFDANSSFYSPDSIQSYINSLSGGFNDLATLEYLSGDIQLGNYSSNLKEIKVLASGSDLLLNAELKHSKMNDLFSLNKDSITWDKLDVLAHVNLDSMQQVFPIEFVKNNRWKKVRIDLETAGNIHAIQIDKLNTVLNGRSTLNTTGQLNNVLHDNRYFCGRLKGNLYEADVHQLLKRQTQFDFPRAIKTDVKLCGTVKDFDLQTKVVSSQGEIYVNTQMIKDSLVADIRLEEYRIGEFLNIDDLNPTSLVVSACALDVFNDDRYVLFDGSVFNTVLQKHNYTDQSFIGSYGNDSLNLVWQSKDTSALFISSYALDMQDSVLFLHVDLDAQGINLNELGLVKEDTIDIATKLNFDLKYVNPSNLKTSLDIQTLSFQYNNYLRSTEKIEMQGSVTDSLTLYVLTSPVIDVVAEFNNSLDSLVPSIQSYLKDEITNKKKSPLNDYLLVQITPKNTQWLLPDSISESTEIELAPMTVEWDAKHSLFDLDFNVKELKGADYDFDNIRLGIHQQGNEFDYSLVSEKLTLLDSAEFNQVGVRGKAGVDLINVYATAKDDENRKVMDFGAEILLDSADIKVSLLDTFIINYDRWKTEQNLTRGNLEYSITHNDSYIVFKPKGNEVSLTMDCLRLPKILYKKTGVTGYFFGDYKLDIEGEWQFDSKWMFQDLYLNNDFIGEVVFDVGVNKERVTADFSSQGPYSDLVGKGFYVLDSTHQSEARFDINFLETSLIESVAQGEISDTRGVISGYLDFVQVESSDYDLNGEVLFDSLFFKVKQLDAPFMIRRGVMKVENKRLTLKNLLVEDSLKNKASFNGSIDFHNTDQVSYNLRGEMPRFLVMDKGKDEAADFYGKLLLSSVIDLKGTNKKPVVDARFDVLKGTSITYVVDNNAIKDLGGNEDLVRFVDQSDTLFIDSLPKEDLKFNLFNLDLTSQLGINPTTKLKILIDPITGDYVEVVGGGDAEMKINPKNPLTLNGRYDISQGFYKMTFYEIASRSFDIKKGSYINWTGNPTNPEVRLVATYKTEASPYPLVAEDVAGTPAEALYKESRSFELEMTIHGFLEDPELSFHITYTDDIASGKQNINQKLDEINRNEEEMNKQVFSVLLFNSFVSPSTQTDASNAINPFQNLGQLLTSQLNNMSKKHVKNVDINFDIDSRQKTNASGSSYQQSDFGVTVKKQVMNDRVTLEVGSGVQYNNNSNTASTSNYVGSAKVEISITEDGNFRLQFYSKNDNSYLGERIIDNGVSLIYRKDFDKVKDLFKTEKQAVDSTATQGQ